jgi:hypothetical protein
VEAVIQIELQGLIDRRDQERKGADAGGRRARGGKGCAGEATSSYLQHACIRPLKTRVSLGCLDPIPDLSNATRRVVDHAPCDARYQPGKSIAKQSISCKLT